MMRRCLVLILAGASLLTAASQDISSLSFDKRLNGKHVQAAAEPLRQTLQEISVVFYAHGDVVSYGLLMNADGDVLTKASELPQGAPLTARIGDKPYTDIANIAHDPATDLALVQIRGVRPASLPEWSPESPRLGAIVASNGSTTRTVRRLRLGIVSAAQRPIPPEPGPAPSTGIVFSPDGAIAEVPPQSPAAQAGLKPGDTIIALDGQPIANLNDLGNLLRHCEPGQTIRLRIQRNGQELDSTLKLGQARQEDDEMNGQASRRRDNFPEAIQHDTLLAPTMLGGPLIDLDGRVVGLNIARVNRAETYALPAALVLQTYERLRQQAEPSGDNGQTAK